MVDQIPSTNPSTEFKDLPFVKDGGRYGPRDFWAVEPTGVPYRDRAIEEARRQPSAVSAKRHTLCTAVRSAEYSHQAVLKSFRPTRCRSAHPRTDELDEFGGDPPPHRTSRPGRWHIEGGKDPHRFEIFECGEPGAG